MAARPVSNGTISFGLVSIPVRLFSATVSRQVSFHLLHKKDDSRIQQKIYCPVDDAIVDRSELVRGFEVEKGRYVTFSDEELKALEAQDDHAIEIDHFLPLDKVDPLYFEGSYWLACEPVAAKAYRLLAEAMAQTGQVALARFTMRGKEHLVLIRPVSEGLVLHTMFYADEVRAAGEVDRGLNAEVKPAELDLAKRLIGELAEKRFQPEKYHDGFRERVLEAAQRKMAGQQVTEAAPEPRRGQVIDLMGALKASLEKRGLKLGEATEQGKEQPAAEGEAKVAKSAGRRAGGERRRAGAKK
jgi:DNA end-binding protein Ku